MSCRFITSAISTRCASRYNSTFLAPPASLSSVGKPTFFPTGIRAERYITAEQLKRFTPRSVSTVSTRSSTGYDPNFIGVPVPLPKFGETLSPDVLQDDSFAERAWTPYIHFSVATNKSRRQPVAVALNVDQDKLLDPRTGDMWEISRRTSSHRWRTDERVGPYQLDNAYYRRNDWDRGHLARRATAAWGDTFEEAEAASISTMVYTNAALQHANLNRDEWLALEDWVVGLKDDKTNKICSITGPIYATEEVAKRFVRPEGGGELAEVPSEFFKVVAFLDKDSKLGVRAFIQAQDERTLVNKRGRRAKAFDLKTFQVPVKLIQEKTGLEFDQTILDANPLLFTTPTSEPEVFLVGGPDELVGPGDKRPTALPSKPVMRIAAVAMNKSGRGWVSLMNVGGSNAELNGWRLRGVVESGESEDIASLADDVLRPGEALRVDTTASSHYGLNLISDSQVQVDTVAGLDEDGLWTTLHR